MQMFGQDARASGRRAKIIIEGNMKVKYSISICTIILLLIGNVYTQSFVIENGFRSQNKIMQENGNQEAVSPDKKYLAINEKQKTIYITNIDRKVLYQIDWDIVKNDIPYSDTICIMGWSKDSKNLWYVSWCPVVLAYVAKIDIEKKRTTFYKMPENGTVEYNIDYDRGVLFYSDFPLVVDQEIQEKIANNPFTLFSMNLENGKITKIATKKGIKFNPTIISAGTLEYIDSNDKPKKYRY